MKFFPGLLRYLGFFLICVTQSSSQTIANCKDQAVVYGSVPKEVEKRIEILAPSLTAGPPKTGKRVASPQGTAWFIEVDPDYMSTQVPWTTTLYIGRSGDAGLFLQTSFKEHGNTFSAQWLNEKLVFIQVWWGRFASSDIVLDVTKGQFVYNEFAHYGLPSGPCE